MPNPLFFKDKHFHTRAKGPSSAFEFAWDLEIFSYANGSKPAHAAARLNRAITMLLEENEEKENRIHLIKQYSLVEIGDPVSISETLMDKSSNLHGLLISHVNEQPQGRRYKWDGRYKHTLGENVRYTIDFSGDHSLCVRLDLPPHCPKNITASYNELMRQSSNPPAPSTTCAAIVVYFLNNCLGFKIRPGNGPTTPSYLFNETCKIALQQNQAREKKFYSQLMDVVSLEEWITAANHLICNHIHRLETEHMQDKAAINGFSLSPTVSVSRLMPYFKNKSSPHRTEEKLDKINLLHTLKENILLKRVGFVLTLLTEQIKEHPEKSGRTYSMFSALLKKHQELQTLNAQPPIPLSKEDQLSFS